MAHMGLRVSAFAEISIGFRGAAIQRGGRGDPARGFEGNGPTVGPPLEERYSYNVEAEIITGIMVPYFLYTSQK